MRSTVQLSLVCLLVSCGPGPTPGTTGGGGGSTATGGGTTTGGGTGGSGGGSVGGGGGGGTSLSELGATCTQGSTCTSGFCVDGVCCDSACTGLCKTCGATSSTGTAGHCSAVANGADPDAECTADTLNCQPGVCNGAGACATSPDGTICRPNTDAGCDVAETCQAGQCPSDARADAGTVCRAARGVCDVEERCDGQAFVCPTDVLLNSPVVCRASQGDCDPLEFCDGADPACPSDVYLDAGVECRAATSVCDVAETCTGAAAACPSDFYADAGTACRASAGECDLAEACTGGSATCPADTFKGNSTACGVNSYFACSGASATCATSCTSNADCYTPAGVTCHDRKLCHNGKWAFISSVSRNGDLGGLDGGDRLCTSLAADAGMSGTFKVWLGTDSDAPAMRFTKPNTPYYELNGTRIATSFTSLTSGTLLAPLNVNELGATVPPTNPWSSVFASGGTVGAQNCSNWTTGLSLGTVATAGRYGNSTSTTGTWSFDNLNQCNTARRVYCFEQ